MTSGIHKSSDKGPDLPAATRDPVAEVGFGGPAGPSPAGGRAAGDDVAMASTGVCSEAGLQRAQGRERLGCGPFRHLIVGQVVATRPAG